MSGNQMLSNELIAREMLKAMKEYLLSDRLVRLADKKPLTKWQKLKNRVLNKFYRVKDIYRYAKHGTSWE